MITVHVLTPFNYHDYKFEVPVGIYGVRTSIAQYTVADGSTEKIDSFLLGLDGAEQHGPIPNDEWDRLITDGFIKYVIYPPL